MLTLLVDHNMEGQAVWLWDTILKIELPDIIDMRMVMFADIGLPENSNDREVWRFAQKSGADLSGADLSNARLIAGDLQKVLLVGAKLDNLDLRYTNIAATDPLLPYNYEQRLLNLSGVNLSGANLSYVDLSYVDLSGANLSNADLSSAKLTHANLTYANLTRANLSFARMENTFLTGANLKDAIWINRQLCRDPSIGECNQY